MNVFQIFRVSRFRQIALCWGLLVVALPPAVLGQEQLFRIEEEPEHVSVSAYYRLDTENVPVDTYSIGPAGGADCSATGVTNYDPLDMLESLSATLTFSESTEPPAGEGRRITFTGHEGTGLALDKTELTFTSANWNVGQVVKITAEEDTDETDEVVTLQMQYTRFLLDGSGEPQTALFACLEVTIIDNDRDRPTGSLFVDKNSVDEGESVTVTVQVSEGLGLDITFPLILVAITAESDDYNSTSPVSLELSSGETEVTYVIQTYEDADTDDETFGVGLGSTNFPPRIKPALPISQLIAIADNDTDTESVSLSVDRNSVNEGQSVAVTVRLSGGLSTGVTIPITLTSGTAESGDYDSMTPVNLSISSGQTQVKHVIQTYEDADIEDETFTVALDTGNLPSGTVAGSPRSQRVTIIDNDSPEVSLSVDRSSVDEGQSVTVTVRLSSGLSTDATIPVTLTAGTAESDDYDNTTPVNLTVSRGETEVEHVIQTYEDADTEDETFTVALDTRNLPSGTVAGSPRSQEVTIIDTDSPEVGLSVDQSSVDEGQSVTVTVQLSNSLSTDVTIPLTLTPGTAELDDYDSTTPVNLSIRSGQTEVEYVIQTYEDSGIEDETFTVALDLENLPSGIEAGSMRSQEVTIVDIDSPEVSLSVDRNSVDEGQSVTVTVQLSGSLSSDVTIPLTLTPGTAEPGDYDSTTPVNLSIRSGQTEVEHVIRTYEDVDTKNETFTVALDPDRLPLGIKAGSPLSQQVTILDPDLPEVSLSADRSSVNEGHSVTVTVYLSDDVSFDVTIPLTVTPGTAESEDYDSTTPVNLNVSSGETEVEYVIQTYEDADTENETFTVELDPDDFPSGIEAGSPLSEQITILDSDVREASLTVDSDSVNEGQSVTVILELSASLSTDVTIPVTLTPGTAESEDYDSTTPVNVEVSSGETEVEHVIQTYADADTKDETFTVALDTENLPAGTVAGSLRSQEVTIIDTDSLGVRLLVDQTSVDEEQSVTVTVQLSDDLSTDVTIPLILTPGTAESEDYDSTTPVNVEVSRGETEVAYVIQTYKDADIEDETFTVALDTAHLPSEVVAGSPVSQEITIVDTDVPGISAPASLEVMDGEATSFNLALTAQPSSDVTVTITGHESTYLTPDRTVLTFTTSTWNVDQTVTLTAAQDNDTVNDEVALTLSASGGGYTVSHNLVVTITDGVRLDVAEPESPLSVTLWGNYPNPLSDVTKIEFDLPARAQVSVMVTDLLGRTVYMLPHEWFEVGKGHTVDIHAGDLPSGVYYYTLKIVMDDETIERSKAMSIVR